MNNPYQAPDSSAADQTMCSRRSVRKSARLMLLKLLCGYFALSVTTIPWIGKFWVGEIPLLVFFQFPKVPLATWLRSQWVMPLFLALGPSNVSTDYVRARPWALLLAYMLPTMIVFAFFAVGTKMTPQQKRWVWITVVLVVVDFFFVLHFSQTRTLTIY